MAQASLPSRRALWTQQNRVEYTHSSQISNLKSEITEWFVNNPEGIEHGFVLPAPPAVERKGDAALRVEPLRVEMEISGDFRAHLSAETQTVSMIDPTGAAQLRYDKLRVFDANQRDVPAHFELNTLATARGTDSTGNRLAIVVEDRGAKYPLGLIRCSRRQPD